MRHMNMPCRRLRNQVTTLAACIVMLVACLFAPGRAAAETVKIGMVKGVICGPVYIAQEKGYFAAQGLTVDIVYFDAAQPIAVASASGDIDFGAVGLTGGLYNLGGQGSLRIISGLFSEAPKFPLIAYLASNRAYAGGLKSLADLSGHSVGVTQIGSALHYALGLAAEKYAVDLKNLRVVPLQANANIASAIVGGQVDAALLNAFYSMPILDRGEVKLLGWVGDETPWQMGAVFTATKSANERHDTIERFLRAFRMGAREYYDAFTGPDKSRKDGPSAPAVAALIAKYLGQSVDQVEASVAYVDPELRLDVKDILHQIAWYRSQGMVKGPVDGEELIDKRYVLRQPEG
jgi:NitT/TauT family transport system substrate-binding protein